MQNNNKQSRLLMLTVSFSLILSLVSTCVFASANNKIKSYTEISSVAREVASQEAENTTTIPSNISSEFKVRIYADSKVIETTANKKVDKDFLAELGLVVNENDYITQSYEKETDTTVINLISVVEEEIKENQIISSTVVSIDNPYLYQGSTAVVQQGVDGEKEITYKVRYENGVEVSRVVISDKIIKIPIDTVVEVGSKPLPQYSKELGFTSLSNGAVPAYVDSFVVNCTAYDLSFESCGKNPGDRGYGITASGMQAGYGVVAVDPKVIPLGTKLYITSLDGSWTYGEAIAGDTGGAIKGKRVDLFFDSKAECLNFGRRQAIVYIIG